MKTVEEREHLEIRPKRAGKEKPLRLRRCSNGRRIGSSGWVRQVSRRLENRDERNKIISSLIDPARDEEMRAGDIDWGHFPCHWKWS